MSFLDNTGLLVHIIHANQNKVVQSLPELIEFLIGADKQVHPFEAFVDHQHFASTASECFEDKLMVPLGEDLARILIGGHVFLRVDFEFLGDIK